MSTSPSEPGLKVLLLSRNAERTALLMEGLRDAGCTDVIITGEARGLLRRIVDSEPDVICAELGSPQPDELEQVFEVARAARRPFALFVDRSDADMIAAAVEAGIGAYIIDGLRKERVGPVLALAVSRFQAFNRLHEEVERARQALEERKIVERAKGILMKSRELTEEEAYALLRKTAMNENRRLAEVAQSLIIAAGLLR